jgi:hypothetical protein
MFQIIFGTIISENLEKMTKEVALEFLKRKIFYRYKTAADLKDD